MSKEQPELNDYLKLFELYEGKLDFSIKETKVGDYSFIFEQIIRLLLKSSPFNDSLPETFISVAVRYTSGDAATAEHFRYNDNKQFFLSDLHDSLELYKSGASRAMR
ncbi:MAG: hypothetical protein R6X15_07795 [Pseudomonadota bacterium]